jgi:quinol monooxygenase YgiN
MVANGLWVQLQAKEGKEEEIEEFLRSGEALVADEPGTVAWFALKIGDGKYGIFDAFNDDEGRDAHLNGEVAKALMAKADDLFESAPEIDRPDVLASKLPS